MKKTIVTMAALMLMGQFYHIPDQVTLVILPAGSYECWPDVDPEQWERRLEFFPSKDYTPSLP